MMPSKAENPTREPSQHRALQPTASELQRFRGKVAVVTGAGSGIGLASAQRFAREGATLALVDIDAAALDRCSESLGWTNGEVGQWQADVADEHQLGVVFNSIRDEFERIDVLHANAGVVVWAGAEDETLDRLRRTLDVNVGGVFLACRAVLPQMKTRGGGAIVTTGSISGMVAERSLLGYCTSKAAVNQMTRQIALDYAADNVRVNAVCPGWIDTPFNDSLTAAMSAQELDTEVRMAVPMQRQGTAEEVASTVAFLASDDASYITGHCLVVDGGYTLK